MTNYSNSDASMVKVMVAHGFERQLIAQRLGICDEELLELYRNELETAGAEADAMVAGSLLRAALGGKLAAICFILKTRDRWSEGAHRKPDRSLEWTNTAPDKLRLAIELATIKSVLLKLRFEANRRGLNLNFERPKNLKARLILPFLKSLKALD